MFLLWPPYWSKVILSNRDICFNKAVLLLWKNGNFSRVAWTILPPPPSIPLGLTLISERFCLGPHVQRKYGFPYGKKYVCPLELPDVSMATIPWPVAWQTYWCMARLSQRINPDGTRGVGGPPRFHPLTSTGSSPQSIAAIFSTIFFGHHVPTLALFISAL